jgi:hypothetical protein
MTNTTEDSGSQLLKSDALGRVRTPPERREQLLDEFERSGISGIKFAELTGLKYQTLATWLQQRKRRRAATTRRKTPAKVRWLEAVVGKTADHGTGPSLPVQLPGGTRMEITSARQVPLAAALLRALEKAGAC